MLPIVNKPTIQYIVKETIKSGIWDSVTLTGNASFAVLLGDDIAQSNTPCLLELINQYEK